LLGRCRQCDNSLRVQAIAVWVSRGIKSLKCPNCGREVATSLSLLAVYAIVASITVISFGYTEDIANLLGFGGSGVVLGFTLIPLGSLVLVYALGFIVAYIKS
jgi:hypothetical protein